jgi:hypothetical protein
MKYYQPYGVTDPNAPYINGDPTIGRQGSIPPASAFEVPMRELVTVIQSSGLTPTDADWTQMMQAVRSQHMNYAIATNSGAGTENAVSVAFNPPLADSVLPGMPLRVKAAANNTGPSVLIVDGVQSPLRKMDGSELEANELIGGGIFECVWNGGGFWSLTNFLGLPGTGGGGGSNTYITKIPYVKDTGSIANHMIAAFSPPITSVVPGDAIEVTLANSITGPTDIVVNALAPRAVVRPNGAPLNPGDATAGQVMLLIVGEDGKFQFAGIIPQAFSGLGTPIGCIVLALGSAAPAGTLKLNGALLNRAEHPGLWAYANTGTRLVDESVWQVASNRMWPAFSRGDGINTFRIPEFRGEYMRFFDDAHGVDVGRVLGAQQFDTVGTFTVSGVVNIDNPKVSMTSPPGPPPGQGASGPYPVTGYPADHWVEDAELAWNVPQGRKVQPDQGEAGPAYGFEYYNQYEITNLSGQMAAQAKSVYWVAPYRSNWPYAGFVQWPNDYGTGVPFYHRTSRLYGNMTLTGGGGGQETRPRNVAVTACIVDG